MLITKVRPMRRTIHLIGDLILIGWSILWGLAAWTLKKTIDLLAAPAEGLGNTTDDLAGRIDDAARQLGDVPMVGSQLAAPFGPIAETLRGVSDEMGSQVAAVQLAGWLVFFILWLMPTLTLALLYLPPRIRRANESAAARDYIDERADLNLFALRAMAKAPMTRIARITPDPVGALRRGDLATIQQLADLELRRVGIGILEIEPEPGPH